MTAVPASIKGVVSEFDRLTAQVLLEAMPAAAIVLDVHGTLIAHNVRAEDLLQGHVSALLGKTIDGPFRMIADRARRATGGEAPTTFE